MNVLKTQQRFRFTKKRVAVGIMHPLCDYLLGYFLPFAPSRGKYRKNRIGETIEIDKDDIFVVDVSYDSGEGQRIVARRLSDGVKVWFFQRSVKQKGIKFIGVVLV